MQMAIEALAASANSPCRMTFTQMIATGMETVAADQTCGPLYQTCVADEQCQGEIASAWRSTLNHAAETMFETNRICSMSRQFRQLYECADNMQTPGNAGNGGWQMSQCWQRDELPPPVCSRVVDQLQDTCPPPRGGWSVSAASAYDCSQRCARAITAAFHYCGTTFASRLQSSANADALYTLLDTEPVGPCVATFRDLLDNGLQSIASGPCSDEYDQCMTSGWCRANVRDAIGANLQIPEAEAAYERGLCKKSPEYQMLYQCLDVGGSGPPWRRASCAEPDKLRPSQCAALLNEIKTGESCPAPDGGWTYDTATSYTCSIDCATKLTAAFFECQSSFFADVDGWTDDTKAALYGLVKQAPEPGPCAVTFTQRVEQQIASVAADAVCGPKFNACARNPECRSSIGEGIGAMGYTPSRIMFESTVCDRPVEYQEFLECAYEVRSRDLPGGRRPWRRTRCLNQDILPPIFCNYILDNLDASCPSDGRPFNPETAETYECSLDCAMTLVTTDHYCESSLYLRAKTWPDEARLALRALAAEGGSCRETFGAVVSAQLQELEADPQCGYIYDYCVADPWCLANLQEAVGALSNPYTVEGWEDHMCEPRHSELFRRLYECIDRKRDGPKAWTRAQCADPDVLTPAQCATLIDDFTPDSNHPACDTPEDGWTPSAINDYTCTDSCANALVTVWRDCQTSWWHYTDTWSEEGRATLVAMVSPDPEFPGPCAATFTDRLESVMTAIRESSECGEMYEGCIGDYHCRNELRDALGRTMSRQSKIQFEGTVCHKSWQFQELYQCFQSRSFSDADATRADGLGEERLQLWPRWTMDRCFAVDKLPPFTCGQISDSLFAPDGRCRGADALTMETAAAYDCPLDCAKGLTDFWYYCATSYGTYMQTQMTYAERAVWYTVIDWDETSPGPCDQVMREYVDGLLRSVETGPCGPQYDNCVGGQNDGWCTANLRDAIRALSSPEYARANFERTMCSKSPDFQWLYQCIRENPVTPQGNAVAPWRMTTCATPDKLMRPQCNVLFSRIPNVCPAPAGGWSPRNAAQYTCSADCARILFTAVRECQTSFATYIDQQYGQGAMFALYILMNPGPQRAGSCAIARQEAVSDRIAAIAEDETCAPLYSACFEDPDCLPTIREAFEAMGYGPSRILFESKLCSKPIKYQRLHECVARITPMPGPSGEDYKPWRITTCLEPDHLPTVFCNYLMDDLRNTCPQQV
eukprot:SAG31_NODE_177_length_21310_cov_8.894064_13_plen_1219_part_00